MAKYYVESGPLRVTIQAENAYDAALEALAWWGQREAGGQPNAHRRHLDEYLRVSERGFGRPDGHRFVTFGAIAHLNGETIEQGWLRVFQSVLGDQQGEK